MIKKMTAVLALFCCSLAIGADFFTPGQVLKAEQLNSALATKTSSADLASTANGKGASLVGFKRQSTNAVNRTAADKFSDTINAKDWGVKCNGSDNDTTAINNALAEAIGKLIEFPAGTCLYAGGGELKDGTVIVGAGRYSTIFKATQTAAPSLFYVSGYGAGLKQVGFKAAVTQTGGVYVMLGGPETFIEDFFMDGDFTGVLMSGNVSRIRHGRFQDGAPGAIRIRAEGGDNSQVIDDILMGAQTPEVSSAGIRVRNNVALTISNTSVIQQGIGLLVDPYSSDTSTPWIIDKGNVLSLTVTDTLFDHNSTAAIKVAPTGNASVARLNFNNVWAASAASDGVQLFNLGSGILSDIDFIHPQIALNAGSGISTSGAVSNLTLVGGIVSNNSYGIYQNNAVSGFRVVGSAVGSASLGGNTNAGIHLAAGSDKIVLVANSFIGNGSAIEDLASAATYKVIQNNVGLANGPISFSGQITSTVATGTAPLVVSSTTPVSNLSIGGNAATVTGLSVASGKTFTASNSLTLAGTDGSTLNVGTGGTLGSAAYTASTAYLAAAGTAANSSQLLGATWASPGAIGSTTPNTGAFSSITVNGGANSFVGYNGSNGTQYFSNAITNYIGGSQITNVTSTGLSVAGSALSSSPSGGIGYKTGAGGTVTQATSKTTNVTLNAVSGNIVTNNSALAAGASATFTLTNSSIGVNDTIIVNVLWNSVTPSNYRVRAGVGSGAAQITLTNDSAGSLSEAVTINFVVIKGSIN